MGSKPNPNPIAPPAVAAQPLPQGPDAEGAPAVAASFWQHPFVQEVMPFLTSVILHLSLALILWKGVEAFVEYSRADNSEQVFMPTATMEEGPEGGIPHPGLGGDPTRDAAQDKVPDVTDTTGWAEKAGPMTTAVLGGGGGESGGESVIGIGGSGMGKGSSVGAGIGTGFGSGEGDGTGPLAPYGIPGGGGGIGPKSTFIGVSGRARLIAYVCDASGSMVNKFDDLRQEIRKSVSNLKPTQAYNVIFFQEESVKSVDSSKLVMATPEARDRTFKFLDATAAHGQTKPEPALELAFKLKPQLIFLLTDGDFPDNDAVLKKIDELNRDRKVKINTIAYIDRGETYEKVLKKIATDNGGIFKYVSETDLGRP
jgi:hypothetical protein